MDVGTIKWRLVALPPGTLIIKMGEALFDREYAEKATALRAAGQVHRQHPEARIELWSYTWDGVFWIGDSAENERLFWCPSCGKRLDDWSTTDMTACRGCGDEWDMDTLMGISIQAPQKPDQPIHATAYV